MIPQNTISQFIEAVRERRNLNGSRVIYLVNDRVIGKLHRSEYVAQNEYNIGRRLFENEVQVPEFYDISSLDPHLISMKTHDQMIWVILMQRIKGKHFPDLECSEQDEALKQFRVELEKILNLGLCPIDIESRLNSLFDTQQRKLYLIDFELYGTTRTEQDDIYYRGFIKRNPFTHQLYT